MTTMLSTATSTATAPDPLPEPLGSVFPIGVDFQPSDSFAQWKSLGINTVIRSPTDDVNTWADAADAAGLYQIRSPRTPAAADIGDPWLLAWAHRDEPDSVRAQIPSERLADQYDEWKQIDPERLAFVNVMGGMDQHDVQTKEHGPSWYRRFFATADLISADRYPINRGRRLTQVGDVVDELQDLGGGKPVFAYIEVSDFDTTDGDRPPTPAELAASSGTPSFTVPVGSSTSRYGSSRRSPSRPLPRMCSPACRRSTNRSRPFKRCCRAISIPRRYTVEVAAPMEVTWRFADGQLYAFVLNMSDQPSSDQQILISGMADAVSARQGDRNVPVQDGTITDDFEP